MGRVLDDERLQRGIDWPVVKVVYSGMQRLISGSNASAVIHQQKVLLELLLEGIHICMVAVRLLLLFFVIVVVAFFLFMAVIVRMVAMFSVFVRVTVVVVIVVVVVVVVMTIVSFFLFVVVMMVVMVMIVGMAMKELVFKESDQGVHLHDWVLL